MNSVLCCGNNKCTTELDNNRAKKHLLVTYQDDLRKKTTKRLAVNMIDVLLKKSIPSNLIITLTSPCEASVKPQTFQWQEPYYRHHYH